MSQSSNILSDIIATTSRFSTSAEVLRRWQAVLSEAEIAARPIPHDNSEETEILSYVQRWGAAMKAIAALTSDFKHRGFQIPAIPDKLDGLFKDAVAFYKAHLPVDTGASNAETAQPSRMPPTVHAGDLDQLPTTHPDNALGISTQDKATVPQLPKPMQSAPPRTEHYKVVAVMSHSGKIVSENYDSEEQKMRIECPAQPCSACKDAGTICTGPVVGRCARCKVSRQRCSNSNAGSKVKTKDKETKGERTRPLRNRRKRQRDDELLLVANAIKTAAPTKSPAGSQHTPTPTPTPDPHPKPSKELLPAPLSLSAPAVEATQQYDDDGFSSPHVSKRHCTVDHSSCNLRSPSQAGPQVPEGSDLEELRARITEFIAQQSDVMHQLAVAQAELQTTALDVQAKFERVAQKVDVQK